jgi:hypothetical protein
MALTLFLSKPSDECATGYGKRGGEYVELKVLHAAQHEAWVIAPARGERRAVAWPNLFGPPGWFWVEARDARDKLRNALGGVLVHMALHYPLLDERAQTFVREIEEIAHDGQRKRVRFHYDACAEVHGFGEGSANMDGGGACEAIESALASTRKNGRRLWEQCRVQRARKAGHAIDVPV